MGRDGLLHVGYQDGRGLEMSSRLEVAPELIAMCEIGVDIQGTSEIKRPWMVGNKALYRLQLDTLSIRQNRRTRCQRQRPDASASKGRNVLLVTGETAGWSQQEGSDRLGRYC